MALKHTWQSAKSDGQDATQLQPSHWNAEHIAEDGVNMGEGAVTRPTTYDNNDGFVGYTGRRASRGLIGAASQYWENLSQPALFMGTHAIWMPPGNSTTVPAVFGMVAPTAQGTATARNVATTNFLSRSRRLGYVSVATAGGFAGHYQTVKQVTTGGGVANGAGFFFSCRFAMTDAAAVSGARAFVGLTTSTSAPTNANPDTLTNCIGVAQLAADSTQLYIVYGGSSAQTPIALSTDFPPMYGAGSTNAPLYELTIAAHPEASNSRVSLTLINLSDNQRYDWTVADLGGNVELPNSSTYLAYRLWRCNNATLLAVGMDIGHTYLETP